MTIKLSIYVKLNKASVENTVRKDATEAIIYFDRYTCKGYIKNTHCIEFYLNELKTAEVMIPLENVLEIGNGEVIKVRLRIDPWHYMTEDEAKEIQATHRENSIEWKQAIRAVLAKHNPTLARFAMENGIY